MHFFAVAETVLLGYVYLQNFKQLSWKRFSKGIMLLFPAVAILNILFVHSIWEFNSYMRMLESILLVILSLYWFYRVFQDLEIEKLTEHPMFFINSGVLLYFSGNFFIFTYYNIMSALDGQIMNEIWHIHSVLNITYNLLYGVALWKMRANYQSE